MNEHQEELAALHALGLLDEAGRKELAQAMELDQEIRFLLQDFAQAAAALAYAAPQVAPPRELKKEILRELGRPRLLPFPLFTAIPYALAASFFLLALYQAGQIGALRSQLSVTGDQLAELRQENSFQQVRLTQLEAQDSRYKQASVVLAWNPAQGSGVLSARNLPAAPTGHAYQLWVLPTSPGQAPVSAGVISSIPRPQPFTLKGAAPAETPGQGFAISLEPSGGSLAPTGQIVFVSAP